MLALDFYHEMEFNIHEGCESPAVTLYFVDEGHRRSAQSRAEGISAAACRRGCEDFRQTDCALTQLWKAFSTEGATRTSGESLRFQNRARHYETDSCCLDPAFFVSGQLEDMK